MSAKNYTSKVYANNPYNSWIVQTSCEDLLTHNGSAAGERQQTLCQLVGIHLARGDNEDSIRTMSEQWASKCNPPFTEWEKHVNNLIAKEQHKKAERVASFDDNNNYDKVGGVVIQDDNIYIQDAQPTLPTLSADAYHGLLGEMLHAITPETEADPSGILLGWLTCFGSIVGRGAYVNVGPRRHHPALFVGIVGKTSDAKGDGWASSLYPFRQLELQWAKNCISNGVGSGEGLVERIADDQTTINSNTGNVGIIPGASDKRCLLRLSELSALFKKQRRENATLSEHLREAWDGDPMSVPNRGSNALASSDYSVSIVGDITPAMLRKLLEGGTEAFDGFANRFLFAAVERKRFLPSGGSIEPLTPFMERLRTALAFGKHAGELKRDADADALWSEVYPSLCLSGDSVPHTDRARPYVLRLSMLYALADCSTTIKVEHLKASLAVWEYCKQSARLLFGQPSQTEAKPEPLWLRVLNTITQRPGISRSELLRAFRSVSAEELDALLVCLEAKKLANRNMVRHGGRPLEQWYPGGIPNDNSKKLYNTV